MSLSLANGLSTILLPQAHKLLTGHAFWVARAQRHRPLPPQPWGGPLCLIGAQDPSPLLSLPARLDPPIDGRSPKFWGEAICNLAIQRPGAKQARDPGPVFSSFSSTPTHPRKFFLSPHSLLQLQAARCDDGDFFLQLLEVTGSGRGCCQSGNFFSLPPLLSTPSPSLRWASHCSVPPTWTPFPKLHRTRPQPPALQTTTRLRHPPSPSPSLGFASRSSRLLLGCSVFFFFVYYILSVFLLSWGFLSPPVAPSHVARPSLTPSLVCPASASRHETCTCCERSRALRDHIAALHLISPDPSDK